MRYWVYKALDQVVNHGAYSNLYLRKHLKEVNEKDKTLATQIFYGTIQNYLYCHTCWSLYAKKKVNKKIDVLLTMSVYQLLFLNRVPNYAVLNDAVSIAKKIDKNSAGFVNAILHKVKPIEDINIALKYSLPDWLYKMWIGQYGQEIADTLTCSSTSTLPIYIRRNQVKISELKFMECSDFEKDGDLYLFKGKEYFQHEFYKNGYMSRQDKGSYEIVKLMDCKENDMILDCCAAPGTKTMAMAEIMQNKGHIDALDLHEHRVKLIRNDAKRLGLSIVYPHVQDACYLEEYGLYDKILCDVPCSGYGVLARKPDIKLRMKNTDMDTLIPLQYSILCSASQHIKKNGTIVYSTCTLNKKENEKQISKFLSEHSNFDLVEEKTIFPDEKQDGFFMAKLVCR